MRTTLIAIIALSVCFGIDAAEVDIPLVIRAVAPAKKPFTISFSGKTKQVGTSTTFSGNVKGLTKNRDARAKFGLTFRGTATNSLGFSGGYAGTMKGSYRQSILSAVAKGTQEFNIDGRFSGMPLKFGARSKFRLEMSKNGFTYTERGVFSSKGSTKGTYWAYMSGTSFKVRVYGIRNGKKFRFRYGGDMAAFADVFTMKITGRYRGILGGKQVSGPLTVPSGANTTS